VAYFFLGHPVDISLDVIVVLPFIVKSVVPAFTRYLFTERSFAWSYSTAYE